jgi:hypothetical protein
MSYGIVRNVLFRGSLRQLTDELLADMNIDILKKSDELSNKAHAIIELKNNLKDQTATIKNYEKRVYARLNSPAKSLFERVTGETLVELDTDEHWRELLQIAGAIDEKLIKIQVEYDRDLRDYETHKSYYEFALSIGRENA